MHLYFHQYELWAEKSPFHTQQMAQIFAYFGNESGYLSQIEHEILVDVTLKWLFRKNPMELQIAHTHTYNSLQNGSVPQGGAVRLTPDIVAVLQRMFATYNAHDNTPIYTDIKSTLSPFATGSIRDSNAKLLLAFLQTQSPHLQRTVADVWNHINLRIVREPKFSEKLPLTQAEKDIIRKNRVEN